ncbi:MULTISPECIES: hypothetical protein [unclassified Bradyrhizobium]|uniref:hypothetical protein n=1 Tax=unclassified Bradyrhizobium TaxID=2631580 RepID=UPI00291632C6|nr:MULTISPECIES: hypothetical protein [unclassified Bradyrhizobium]
MAENQGSNLFDLIKGAFWPVLGLILTFAFYSPIYRIFDSVSQRAASIEKLKLGQLELNIRISDLPVPTTQTASVLPKFSEAMIMELIHTTGDGGGPCFTNGVTRQSDTRFDALSALADLKQIDFHIAAHQVPVCQVAYDAILTQDGIATRKFLMDLLATQVTRSRTSNH